jgi:hypothetical protein
LVQTLPYSTLEDSFFRIDCMGSGGDAKHLLEMTPEARVML